MNRKQVISDTRTLVELIQTRQLPFLAAAIAYYAFLSVVPLLIVGVTVATAFAGQAIATELLQSLDEFLTPEAADLIEGALVDGAGRGGVTFVGLGVLLWGALRVFRGLDIAFSRIYGEKASKSIVWQIRDALLVLGGILLAVGGTAALGTVLSLVDLPFARATSTVSLMVVLSVIFLPMYYIFPGQQIALREALPGAVAASLGWTALGAVFGIYASNAGSLQLYGVLGGVLLLLIWFYFGGLILLLGAAVNVVLGESVEDRQLQQEGLRDSIQRSMTDADGPTEEEPADGSRDESGKADDPLADETTAVTDAAEKAGAGPPGDGPPGDGSSQGDDDDDEPTGRQDPDVSAQITQKDIDDLRREIDKIENRLDEQTVHRDEIESDLKKYVRKRSRRGHATGWGPYLVLLYGTVMTLGAFFFLSSGFAVLAMIIIWLSTLGLYALMLIVGITVKGVRLPGSLLDTVRNLR